MRLVEPDEDGGSVVAGLHLDGDYSPRLPAFDVGMVIQVDIVSRPNPITDFQSCNVIEVHAASSTNVPSRSLRQMFNRLIGGRSR